MISPFEAIPHLKLPPSKLLQVLAAIRDNEGSRDEATKAILELFPGKSAKSAVRGMAIPAVTRLQFARTREGAVVLAPNGLGVFSAGLPSQEFVAIAVRGVALERFGVPLRFLGNARGLKFESLSAPGTVRERASRFASYLSEFPLHPGLWKTHGFELFPDAQFELTPPLAATRALIRSALRSGGLWEIDAARKRVLSAAWHSHWLATALDVDRWFVRELSVSRPSITLWKQGFRSIDEIFERGVSYGGVSLTG
jgi:hypothetical protein